MRKIAWFSLFFGIAAAVYAALMTPIPGYILGAAAAAVFFLLLCCRHGRSRAALAALGLAAGLLWTACYDALLLAPIRQLDSRTESFTVTLRDDPQSTGYGARVYGSAELSGRNCRILLYLDDMPEARCGDRMALTARLALPGGEDYDLYYRSIGVQLIAYARPGVKRIDADSGPFRRFPLFLRRKLLERIDALFPSDSTGFVRALLTGERSGLSYAQKNALSVSGISHTVAISGMHISILLGMIVLLCGNRRWLNAAIGIPIIVIFTLMAGAQPSVVRAAVMQSIMLLAPLLMREYDPLTALGAAALCILIPNPWAVANLSFQLSFGSMLGILLFSGRLNRALAAAVPARKRPRSRFTRPILRYILATAASTLSACVFTVPVIAWQFGTVSLMSLFTNLLTLWAVTLAFELSLAACILSFVWIIPARAPAWLAAWLVRYILGVARLITRIPVSAVYTDNIYIIAWLVFLYLAFGVCLLYRKKQLLLPCVCAGVICLCLSVWFGYFEANRGEAAFTALDIGQGQCLIFEQNGLTLMYDCGGSNADAAGEAAARFLLSRAAPRVDILILSHYDLDHAGGVCQLLSRIPVDTVYLPDIPCDTTLRSRIEASAAEQGSALHYLTRDESLRLGDSSLRIFAPIDADSENDASVALLYSRGDYDILATGDMTAASERKLLSRGSLPDIEVLVAGHHGAATSTCEALLEMTAPETVVISVGAGNSYGHPADDTIARIEAAGAQVYRTDLCGNITIRR